jgi:tRNA (pseudouridine54-N1)-methyltransferase
MRRFVVIGQKASGSPDFSLVDLPATSGRLDVLLRCLRASLLVSHGVRRDTMVYLVLLGDETAPRVLRVEGAAVRFLRPDERSLATLVQKSLAAAREGAGFVSVRPGIAVADGGLDVVLDDVGRATFYVLEEGAADVRQATIDVGDPVFFVGDHAGFDAPTRARLASIGARPVSVGPVSLHADDIVALVNNELDRRAPGEPAVAGMGRPPLPFDHDDEPT